MTFHLAPGTALITGASSGIGAAFARQLAARGCHLILVARRADRLQALASELQARHSIKAEVLPADLANEPDLVRVEARLRACPDLTLLVNNAGFGAGGLFHQIDPAKQLGMIQVHVVATTRLTRAALPVLVERGHGGVITVASIAAFAALPASAMYGATKAWQVAFSRALAGEVRDAGVRVQALCPGFTYTEFHDTPEFKDFDRRAIPGFMWMSSEAVADASLRALERDRMLCIPGLVNRLLAAWLRFPPGAALAWYWARRRGRN
jgi:short-subunit dehydrogenase